MSVPKMHFCYWSVQCSI